MSIKQISKELIKAFTTNNKRLTRLDFSKNKISVIENLNELKHLQVLDLSDNQIESIDGLNELSSLIELNLGTNKIERVNNLRNLKSLQILDLSFNRIKDINDLGELRFNKELRELNIQGNIGITSHYNFRDQIKQLIPQLQIIDGLKVTSHPLQIPQEQIEHKQIQALQDVITILEKQVQVPSQNIDALQQWRKKCHELLLREKIMNYRLNQQDISNKNLEQEKNHLKSQLEQSNKEIIFLKEQIQQQTNQFHNEQKESAALIQDQFLKQMNIIQDTFNQQIKQQENRFFNLEGTLLKQKQKILTQQRKTNNDFFEFKQSLKTIIKTYTEKDIQYDINSSDYLNEVQKIIRNSLIQLQDTQFKQQTTSKYEIQQFQEEINNLNQQKKNLTSLLSEMEERISKVNRNSEQKLKETKDELDFKSQKVKEQNTLIYELEQKLDKEIQEKQSYKSKITELEMNFDIQIKKKAEETSQKLKEKVEELEKENIKLIQNLKTKEQEINSLKDQMDKKITQIEIEKASEINTLESQLQIETEKRIMISNQRNDMVRIINMKENKIKEIRNESRQLQEKLNQTVQGDFYQYNKPNISSQEIYPNQNHMMSYQNQRLGLNQQRNSQNLFNNTNNNDHQHFKNNDLSSNNIINNNNNYNNRLNQTDIQYKPYQRSQEDWSPIGTNPNNSNNNFNGNRLPLRNTMKNQDINNFNTNKANMILNDLSMINNEQHGETLEDVIKKCDYNEKFAEDLFNDDL